MMAKVVHTSVYQRVKSEVFNVANNLYCLGSWLNADIYIVYINIVRIIIFL